MCASARSLRCAEAGLCATAAAAASRCQPLPLPVPKVANEPGLAPALLELMGSWPRGAELSLRRPQRYNLGPATQTPFAEVRGQGHSS